jgi:hypothetical protein
MYVFFSAEPVLAASCSHNHALYVESMITNNGIMDVALSETLQQKALDHIGHNIPITYSKNQASIILRLNGSANIHKKKYHSNKSNDLDTASVNRLQLKS